MTEETQTQTQPEQGAESQSATTAPEKTIPEQVELATQALVAGADTAEFSEAVMIAAQAKKEALEATSQLAASQEQNKMLQEKAEKVDPYTLLSDEQKNELESLKETDFEAYYAKRQEFEKEAKAKFTQVSSEANVQSQLEAAIAVHNARNPNMPFSLETLEQDIPLRLKNDITEKMNSGTMTPSDAVNAVAEFLRGSKKIGATEQPATVPNLSDAPGGSTLPAGTQVEDPNDYQVY